jgi:hypothetical protein
VYHTNWTLFDFSDLLSLLWHYDRAAMAHQLELAGYYRAAWEALLRALELDEADLGQWLLQAEAPVMSSLPAFVEREAPFSEDLLSRAVVVTNLFALREAVLTFGVDETDWLNTEGAIDNIQDDELRQGINDLYGRTLPLHIDELSAILTPIDDLLYAFLLAWHPRRQVTLQNLMMHYSFPNPAHYTDRFTL